MSLEDVRTGILNCTSCRLWETRSRAVPGDGFANARIFVVGEAPGFQEEIQGRPFVGKSGKFLMELFASIGIVRRDMYVANRVNCRPPDNRDPLPDELEACRHWVFDQLNLIDPKVIVTCGRFSMKLFFPSSSITDLHGKARWDGKRLYFPSLHPAAALYRPELRSVIQEDFYKLGQILKDFHLF
jgi:DNA polymerase